MDSLIFKSFLPEIFFSTATLMLIVLNTRTINNLKYNFPIIDKEIFSQIVFVLILFIIFQNDLRIEGVFSTHTLLNDSPLRLAKQILAFFTIVALILVNEAYTLQKLSFVEFYFIFALSLLAFFLMISCSNLLMFYVLMELQALSFYVLASFNRNSVFSLEAGLKYFVYGAFASGIYLLGVSFLYGALGTISLNNLNALLSFSLNSYNESINYIVIVSIAFITVSLFFKIAVVPFYEWVVDVYEGSPLSSTIIFSIIPKIPLFFFLSKWFLILSNKSQLLFIVATLGIVTILVGTFGALAQKRLKRLLIFSSIAQTGFLVAGLSYPHITGYMYSFFFLGVYLITSILVWGHFVLFHYFSHKTNTHYLSKYTTLYVSTIRGLFKFQPFWAFSFIIIFFSIAGIPPLGGFLSKMFIIYSCISIKNHLFALVLILATSISVFYYLKILKVAFFEPKTNKNKEDFRTIYPLDSITIIIPIFLSFLLVVFFLPNLFLSACHFISLGSFIL